MQLEDATVAHRLSWHRREVSATVATGVRAVPWMPARWPGKLPLTRTAPMPAHLSSLRGPIALQRAEPRSRPARWDHERFLTVLTAYDRAQFTPGSLEAGHRAVLLAARYPRRRYLPRLPTPLALDRGNTAIARPGAVPLVPRRRRHEFLLTTATDSLDRFSAANPRADAPTVDGGAGLQPVGVGLERLTTSRVRAGDRDPCSLGEPRAPRRAVAAFALRGAKRTTLLTRDRLLRFRRTVTLDRAVLAAAPPEASLEHTERLGADQTGPLNRCSSRTIVAGRRAVLTLLRREYAATRARPRQIVHHSVSIAEKCDIS